VRFVPALLVVLLGACAGAEASIPDVPPSNASAPIPTADAVPLPLAPLTPIDPTRLPPDQRAAISALAAVASPLFPAGANGHGHSHGGQQSIAPLAPAEQTELDREWATAAAAASQVDTAEKAHAAGYVIASTNAPGVGVHFVNWELIDRPFDPAKPSMLLFDMRGPEPVLAGFSYWLRSEQAPEGFAGANDHWHQHSGLCIVNGWVDREEVEGPNLCAGSYLGGRDLWMLHAWVVPGYRNRWGDFADTNPLLCPSVASSPDIARCPSAPALG
jgi:hypothetical protein